MVASAPGVSDVAPFVPAARACDGEHFFGGSVACNRLYWRPLLDIEIHRDPHSVLPCRRSSAGAPWPSASLLFPAVPHEVTELTARGVRLSPRMVNVIRLAPPPLEARGREDPR